MQRNVPQDATIYEPEVRHDVSFEKRLVLRKVGDAERVLEVGANSGHFSALLKAQGCYVTAIELNSEAARKARQSADRVICGDIEDPCIWEEVEGSFDIILFMHVLEHLADPWSVLRNARQVLNSDGRILVLLPNIACWRVRKALFFKGKFDYTELGIMDKTHLRFFTLNSARELIESAGLEINSWRATDICVPFERRMSMIHGLRGLSNLWHKKISSRFPNLCSEIVFFECSFQKAAGKNLVR